MVNIEHPTLKRSKLGLFAILLAIALSLQADTQTERRFLSQLSSELAQLEQLIQRAEQARDVNDRLQFRYDWLRKDLQLIRGGIDAYIDEYHLTPRSFPPLKGEYVQ